MAKKGIIYKEPSSYFNADMLKAADAYDKKKAAEKKKSATKSNKK